jgi:hypothetical protein
MVRSLPFGEPNAMGKDLLSSIESFSATQFDDLTFLVLGT